jgi:hypothetical protein
MLLISESDAIVDKLGAGDSITAFHVVCMIGGDERSITMWFNGHE